MALPVLYSFRRCPFAMRARLAILASGITVEMREVLLRDKPAAFLAASPKATVPVLLLEGGRVVDESLDIMYWCLARSDPKGWLPEKADAPFIMDLIKRADTEFKPYLDLYKYAARHPENDPLKARNNASLFLDRLDQRLSGLTYLSGMEFGLADAAILPFVRQFANVDRGWFSAQPWLLVHRWLENFLDSVIFQRIMLRYPPWQAHHSVSNFPQEVSNAP